MAGVAGPKTEPTAPRPTEGDSPPSIELRSVTKIFSLESGERVPGVQDVSLSVPRGEFLCLVGPSGHGKSTLLNLIAGFVEPTSGEVLVNGRPVTGPGPDRGVVFQRDTLFMWRRVADNIGFGLEARGVPRRERKEIVERYLRIIELERFARAWPKQLSGGMRRRVAIAAVFANEPDVLLMDEPFVGLDYVRRATLHKVLLDLWKGSGCTVFFITHDVDEALTLADRVLVVVNGHIVHGATVPFPRPRSAQVVNSAEGSEMRVRILTEIGSVLEAGE